MKQEYTKIGLELMKGHQIHKEAILNNNMRVLDAWIHSGIISRRMPAKPEAPEFGDKYLVMMNEDGEWPCEIGKIAIFLDKWHFIKPEVGAMFWINDEQRLIVKVDEESWRELNFD